MKFRFQMINMFISYKHQLCIKNSFFHGHTNKIKNEYTPTKNITGILYKHVYTPSFVRKPKFGMSTGRTLTGNVSTKHVINC